MALPTCPGSAAAVVTALALSGDADSIDRSAAIEAMRLRVEKLLDPNSDHVLAELAAHAAMLSALSQRWSVAAMGARNADHASKFQRMATGCHTAYVRTLIAMEGLRAQRKGSASVTLTDAPDDDSHQGGGLGLGPDHDSDGAPDFEH